MRPIPFATAIAAIALAACSKTTPPASPAFTLHYHRAASDYSGWTAQVASGAVETSAASSTKDGFGALYPLTVAKGATALTLSLGNGGSSDPAGTLSVDVSGTVREAWVFSGYPLAIAHAPVAVPSGPTQVALYYVRPDKSYAGWGVHLWGDQVTETAWSSPLQAKGSDADLGLGFVIDIKTGGQP